MIIFWHGEIFEFSWFFFCLKILLNAKATVWHTPLLGICMVDWVVARYGVTMIWLLNQIYQLRISFKLTILLWSHYYDIICVSFFERNKNNLILVLDFWSLQKRTACHLIKVLEILSRYWFSLQLICNNYKLANSYMYKPCLENLTTSLVMHF
jgi:hypothetical protein